MTALLLEPDTFTYPPFTLAEWQGMLRDGLIRRSAGGVWVSASVPDTPATRAQCAAEAMGQGLRYRSVVGWQSAAWIHGWSNPPQRINLLIDQRRRMGSAYSTGRPVLIHEVRDAVARSLRIGTIFVSDPVRTVFDVARYCSDEDAAEILRRAFAVPGLVSQLADVQRRGGDVIPQRQRSRMRRRLKTAFRQAQTLEDCDVDSLC